METPENTPKVSVMPEKGTAEEKVVGQNDHPLQKKSSPTQPILIGGIILLVLLGSGLYLFSKSTMVPQMPKQVNQNVTQTVSLSPSPQPTLPRSKALGIILSVVTAKGIDPKTGEAINPTSTFQTTDKSIYAVAKLKNAKIGTKIEYTRYLNNKFVDNRSITIVKANTNNASFVWTLKNSTAAHLIGNYKIKLYTNGIFEKEISYIVQ